MRLVKICEKMVRKVPIMKDRRARGTRQRLEIDILEQVQGLNLFENLQSHDLNSSCDGESHILLLIKKIIRKFVNIRLKKMCRDISEKLSAVGKRSALSRILILKNL